MSQELNETFWTKRYKEGSTGWDIGSPSTPLKEYIDGLRDKNIRILIPGCGNSYEGEYLWKMGFQNVFLSDLSSEPLEHFSARVKDFPKEQLLNGDFFELEGSFDLILEQTFYCAIDPEWRDRYVHKVNELLKPGGILAGVLFTFPLTEEGPPFGGSLQEYKQRFGKFFNIKVLEECRNSIPPRSGREAFILLEKP